MPRRSGWRLCAGGHAVFTACRPTFDLREEPGALAAHAGICAGGGEQSSSRDLAIISATSCSRWRADVGAPSLRDCNRSSYSATLAFTASDKSSIPCLQIVSTARLRRVDGFPVLGLLRRLRPRCARSPVASAIRPRRGRKRGRVPKFHRCSLFAVGADSTPCGIWLPGLAGFPGR
jgi:hypothetical protein